MSKITITAFVLWLTSIAVVRADQWNPPKSFEESFYGKFSVHVQVHESEKKTASVEISNKNKKSVVKLCSGTLLNPKRPLKVYLSQDGKTLVTADEWGNAGFDHALGFYRCDKTVTLLKEYQLEDFMTPDEIMKYAPQSVSSRNWQKSVILKVEKDVLIVKLKSGRMVKFSLSDGTIQHNTKKENRP